jgi:hypothetical protein
MAGFANWLAYSQVRRVIMMAAMFPLPVLGILSSAIIAMTAQQRGWQKALAEMLFALALLTAMSLLVGLPVTATAFAAMNWGLLLVLGSIVGATRSLTLATQVAVILGLAALLGMRLVLGDPVEFWTPVLEQLYADLAVDGVELQVDLRAQASIAGAALLTGTFVGGMLSLLLGSRWASVLVPQPEVQPFAELRLGYALGGLAAVAGIASILSVPADGALLILGTAFMLQGLAVVVWWSQLKMWPGGWWLGALVVMLLLPNVFVMVTILLAAVGFVDNWYDLRRTSWKL